MATTIISNSNVDLNAPATYSIKLGASILKPAESATKYASVRYNHKPQSQESKKATGSIKPGKDGRGSRLLLQNGGEEYGYTGKSVDVGDGYVLVLRGEGKNVQAVLEKLSSTHAFNLTKTPSEADTATLKDQYPQINAQDEEEDDLFGNEDTSDEPIDADNPYDYRHFLKVAAQQKAKKTDAEGPRSGIGTPMAQARVASSTPLARPTKRAGDSALVQQKKRKATGSAAEQASTKRAKASQEVAASAPQKPTKEPAAKTDPPPKIRVDRKASLRRTSYDDSGELILENETPVSDKRPSGRSAMSLALSGQLGQGPISLRSAASSPASHIASPAPVRPEGMDGEDGEFEIGVADSPEDATQQYRRPVEEPEDAEMEDDDADVEDLELPSPAAVHKPSISAATVTSAGDEDDLDAQLAAAMAEEEIVPAVAEDEEESEEE